MYIVQWVIGHSLSWIFNNDAYILIVCFVHVHVILYCVEQICDTLMIKLCISIINMTTVTNDVSKQTT